MVVMQGFQWCNNGGGMGGWGRRLELASVASLGRTRFNSSSRIKVLTLVAGFEEQCKISKSKLHPRTGSKVS